MKQKIANIWDEIVWYVWEIPRGAYRSARHWYRCSCNKTHLKNVWNHMFHTYQWDYEYIYELQHGWLKEAIRYYETQTLYISDEHINYTLRWMKLALACLDIILERRELYEMIPSRRGDTSLLGRHDYVSLVYVNLRNAHRFKYKCITDDYKRHNYSDDMYFFAHDELYKAKAKHIYLNILKEYGDGWWD